MALIKPMKSTLEWPIYYLTNGRPSKLPLLQASQQYLLHKWLAQMYCAKRQLNMLPCQRMPTQSKI